MSRGKLYAMVGSLGIMAVVAAVALTLVFSQGGSGPAGRSPEPVASAVGLARTSSDTATDGVGPAKALPQGEPVSESGLEAAVKPPEPSGGGPSEGIKVHGHWTIEVREHDGTLVSRTEFQNALVQPPFILQNVLARQSSVGWWTVQIQQIFGTPVNPCPSFVLGTTTYAGCGITESGNPTTAVAGLFKTLSVTAPTSGTDANKVVLTGSATAQQNGSIDNVTTWNLLCSAATAPSSPCAPTSTTFSNSFSSSNLTIVSVVAGQQVLFTVKFSFS